MIAEFAYLIMSGYRYRLCADWFEHNVFFKICCLLVKAAVSMKNHVHLMKVRRLQKMSVKTAMAMLRGRKRIRRILQYLQGLRQNLVS